MSARHRWSGWPGAFCLDCGSENALEAALACEHCDIPMPDMHEPIYGEAIEGKLCALHEAMATALASGCPPTPETVAIYNSLAK